MDKKTNLAYEAARELYASIGVDTDAAIAALDGVELSLHCWQGDDVGGFEKEDSVLTGGIMATGNYPGKARTPSELWMDLDKTMSLLPGKQKVNVHAIYIDSPSKADRNQIEPSHFAGWVAWAKDHGIGLDFNPTYFAHEKSSDGLTLSHPDRAIRNFWVEHGKRCRKIGEYFGKETGKTCVTNVWIPDGFKDNPIDKLAPRERLCASLDEIFAARIDPKFNRDAVESKLFGIGSEAYVTGSHEFYMGYCLSRGNVMPTLDAGHFHPTESVAQKISAMLLFMPQLLMHVSRPIRWDSDHVVVYDDELATIMHEIVRCNALNKVYLALDYFDASINRIAAWVIGARNTQKALLSALLEPIAALKKVEADGDFTSRLALVEEYKSYPLGAVWDYYCMSRDVPVREAWLAEVKEYERSVLADRI